MLLEAAGQDPGRYAAGQGPAAHAALGCEVGLRPASCNQIYAQGPSGEELPSPPSRARMDEDRALSPCPRLSCSPLASRSPSPTYSGKPAPLIRSVPSACTAPSALL